MDNQEEIKEWKNRVLHWQQQGARLEIENAELKVKIGYFQNTFCSNAKFIQLKGLDDPFQVIANERVTQVLNERDELREKIEAWKNLSVALDKRIVGLEKIKGCAKQTIAHWDEFGPEYGLEESMHWLDRSIKMYEKDERE
jgi:hypothetical protein